MTVTVYVRLGFGAESQASKGIDGSLIVLESRR
jgi:hypothetical protein